MATVYEHTILDGDAGVRQTVAHMSALIRGAIAQPIVRSAATAIVGGFAPNDVLGQLYAIRDFLAAHIVFLRDPAGVELLHSPEWMLRDIHAHGATHVDCDDAAILGGALAGAVGFRVALTTVAFLDKTGRPDIYSPMSHVWAAAAPPVDILDSAGDPIWIELDVTRPAQAIPEGMISRSEVTPVIG